MTPYDTPDFFALCALEILKTFEIRSFFYEKWLLSHVLAGRKVSNWNASVPLLTFRPWYHIMWGKAHLEQQAIGLHSDTVAYREQYHDYYSRREAIEDFYERSLQTKENGTWLIFDSYYEELAGNMGLRPALIFAIALIAVLSASCEKKRLFRVLCVTKWGHKTLVRTKAGTVFACCALLTILFYLKDLLLFASFSSFSYLKAPVQSISVLAAFPIQVSIGAWLVFALILNLLLYSGLGVLMVWIQMNHL